ncbi:MAG: DinB family protein [Lewinella sp.]
MTKMILSLLLLFTLGHSLSAQSATDFPAQVEWLEKWESSRAYTLEALALIPDTSLTFRPTEGQMSVQEQIQHISGNMFGLSRRFLDYEPDNFDEKALSNQLKAEFLDREALTTLLNKAYDFGAAAVKNLPAERWEEEVPNFFAGPKSRRVIVYLLQDHATHHRAQVLIYLRLLGLDPPRYRGW